MHRPLRLAPSFTRTFSGPATLGPLKSAELGEEFLVLSNWHSSVIQKLLTLCVCSLHLNWYTRCTPLVRVQARHVALKAPRPNESGNECHYSYFQGECRNPPAFLCNVHGEGSRSRALPSLYGWDRSTSPQMSTHQHAVSHTQRHQVAGSINQGAPTDWCLLQLDHVECGWLHINGSTVVARWTCLNRIEMGRPLSRCLPRVHCRGIQGDSCIHLGCNCSGTHCQTRLGMVPSVQHVSLGLGLEGCTWYTNPGAVSRHTGLGASG